MNHNGEQYIPAPKIAYRAIGGQVVIVKPQASRFITLNETASLVWSHLEDSDVHSIAVLVSQEFDVPFETALNDVEAFIDKLVRNELVVHRAVQGAGVV